LFFVYKNNSQVYMDCVANKTETYFEKKISLRISVKVYLTFVSAMILLNNQSRSL
jgi:hypothetical protein